MRGGGQADVVSRTSELEALGLLVLTSLLGGGLGFTLGRSLLTPIQAEVVQRAAGSTAEVGRSAREMPELAESLRLLVDQYGVYKHAEELASGGSSCFVGLIGKLFPFAPINVREGMTGEPRLAPRWSPLDMPTSAEMPP